MFSRYMNSVTFVRLFYTQNTWSYHWKVQVMISFSRVCTDFIFCSILAELLIIIMLWTDHNIGELCQAWLVLQGLRNTKIHCSIALISFCSCYDIVTSVLKLALRAEVNDTTMYLRGLVGVLFSSKTYSEISDRVSLQNLSCYWQWKQ